MKYKPGQILKIIEYSGVLVFDKDYSFPNLTRTIEYLKSEAKIIVLEHEIWDNGRNFVRVLTESGKVGVIFYFDKRFEKIN